MKQCSKCKSLKEHSQFNKDKNRKDGHQGYCRKCAIERNTKYNREVKGHLSMSENKTCAQYLGIAVAERLVRHLFKDVITMPYGNPGYDFICAKDKKIDVKSACITMNNKINPIWAFYIRKNQIADYFLLLAFDNRQDIEPIHQWLIPGDVLNHQISISISPSTILKWDAYQQDIDAAQICCNTMKNQIML